jgi:E3 ubiquitin-protein ligase TRIP12
MYRSAPTSNRLLSKRWSDREQVLHQNRLQTARPRVDSASPRPCPHLKHRLKQQQLAEDRCTEIERANRILLEKMAIVLSTKPRNYPLLRPGSLNKLQRKRALATISSENQALLRRLKLQAPNYSAAKWRTTERKTEELLRLRCEFPYQLTPKLRTRSCTPVEKRKGRSAVTEEERFVVFRGATALDEHEYLVEMSTDQRLFWIVAFSRDGPESVSAELTYSEAMERTEGLGYERLLAALVLEAGSLSLRPSGIQTMR